MDKRLEILCNLYDRSDESVDVDTLLKVCFFYSLRGVLRLLSSKQCVKFGYLCSKSVLYLNNEKTKDKAEKCLKLVEKWLENPNSVSSDELINSAHNSIPLNYNASRAIYYITKATYNLSNNRFGSRSIVDDFIEYSVCYSISAVKNKQKQEYKNLGFLVKVIRDES